MKLNDTFILTKKAGALLNPIRGEASGVLHL